MTNYILKAGTLNDDILKISDKGKVFKGGYIAIIEYYTFENEWCNSVKYVRFRSQKSLDKYLKSHYPEFDYYA